MGTLTGVHHFPKGLEMTAKKTAKTTKPPVVIWDGIEFKETTKAEANKLIKAKKAQLVDGSLDGTGFKHYDEFEGNKKPYKNKMMKTGK